MEMYLELALKMFADCPKYILCSGCKPIHLGQVGTFPSVHTMSCIIIFMVVTFAYGLVG